jgi:hypothetical protein
MKPAWTRPADLRAQLQKCWDRGELLARMQDADNSFPKRLTLKGPTSSEIADRYEAVRLWAKEIMAAPHCRIELRSFAHRVVGFNSIPAEAWIDSLDDALAMLGKRNEAARFRALLDLTGQRQPALLSWLVKRPLKALELGERWQLLLDIVDWMQQHQRPGVYLRQVNVPGVHSKFIEAHKGVLAELFDLSLPPDAIQPGATGAGQFAARYGFLDKPARIRFRVLDPAKSPIAGGGMADVTLDSSSFAQLPAPAGRIFITENETNFLAFPALADSLVIFGKGYGWDNLADARWLTDCVVYYWGDIDTHGFAILNQLRGKFAHVESFLMDRATLMAHESLWGTEDDQALHDLPLLTADERDLFNDLRDNRIRNNLRLEQEFVRFSWIERELAKLFG